MDWNKVKTRVVFRNDTLEEVARFPFVINDPNHGLPNWVFGLDDEGKLIPDAPTYCYLETDDAGTWGFTGGMGVDWTGNANSLREAIDQVDKWLMGE